MPANSAISGFEKGPSDSPRTSLSQPTERGLATYSCRLSPYGFACGSTTSLSNTIRRGLCAFVVIGLGIVKSITTSASVKQQFEECLANLHGSPKVSSDLDR